MRRMIGLVMVVAAVVAACGDGGVEAGAPGAPDSVRGVWSVVELDGEPVVPGVNTSDQPYFDIGASSVDAKLGCNNGGGRYDYDGDRIRFREFASELAGCMPDERMTVELAIGEMIGERIRVLRSGDRMTWTSDSHTLRMVLVDAPPTTVYVAPVRSTWGSLDCGDEIVAEDNRVSADVAPLVMAQRYESDVTMVVEVAPLQYEAYDADGVLRLFVFVQDDGTGDYQIVHCEPG